MTSQGRKAKPAKSLRASISFPPEVYGELEKLAAAKKVSLAWIVREATEKYLADQWPLLAERR
ncbi:MAG: ribbon-helix-helix protein, CopG family [Steroidobacteraceae bacterium]|jgi:predicted DNA-binding protein